MSHDRNTDRSQPEHNIRDFNASLDFDTLYMTFSDERVYAPNSSYLNPPLKDGAVLVWTDANMSPVRA